MSTSISSVVVNAIRQVRLKVASPTERFSVLTLTIAGILTTQSLLGLMWPGIRYARVPSQEGPTIKGMPVPSCTQALTLIPGNTIRMPWNVFTSSFIEPTLLGLVLSLAVLFMTASVAEAVYGPTDFAKLICVAAVSSGAVCFVVQYIMFIVTRRGSALFSETGGFSGVQGALLVAVKHVLPGQEILVLPGVAVSTQYLPGIFLVICTAWSLITAEIGLLRFALIGTYSGWFYLRFVKVSGPDGMRGDPSADFALSTMCPQAAQPTLSVAFTAIAKVCGLHRAAAPTLPVTHPASSATAASGPAAGPSRSHEEDAQQARDAARRREVGRQALEARLLAAGIQTSEAVGSASSSPDATRGLSNAGSSAGGSPFIDQIESQ